MSNPYETPQAEGGANPAIVSEISSKATTSLVTGILSIFCCALLGIWAIIAANQANQLIQQHGVGHEQKGKATAGMICGIIGLLLWGVGIVLQAMMAGANA